MSKSNFSNVYDDDNIPEVDLPRDNTSTNATSNATNNSSNSVSNSTNLTSKPNYNVEPLPESSRPRKDGPGGA